MFCIKQVRRPLKILNYYFREQQTAKKTTCLKYKILTSVGLKNIGTGITKKRKNVNSFFEAVICVTVKLHKHLALRFEFNMDV